MIEVEAARAMISKAEEHRLGLLGACRLVKIDHRPDSTVAANTAHYDGRNAWNSRIVRTRMQSRDEAGPWRKSVELASLLH
jgi:hypothetical protein